MKSLVIAMMLVFSSVGYCSTKVSLSDFIQKYLAASHDLNLKQSLIETSLEKKQEAKISFLPSTSAGVSATDSNLAGNNTRTESFFKISQNLFSGFKDLSNFKSSEKDLAKANWDFKAQELKEILNGLELYFNFFKAQKDLENIQKQIENNKKSLDEMNRNARAGNARKTQVINLEAAISSNQIDLSDAQATFNGIVVTAKNYLGLDLTELVIDYPTFTFEASHVDKIISSLSIDERPELKSMNENLSVLEYKIDIVNSSNLPSLDLSGTYYLSDTLKGTTSLKNTYTLGLTLTIPFPFGLETRSKVNQARIDKNYAFIAFNQKKSDLVRERDLLVNEMVFSLKKREAIKDSLRILKENVDYLKKDYRMGLSTYSEYLSANSTFQEMQRKYDNSLIQFEYICYKAKAWSMNLNSVLKQGKN